MNTYTLVTAFYIFLGSETGYALSPRKGRPRSVTDSAVTVRGRPFQGPKSVPRFGVRILKEILKANTKKRP